MPDVEKFSFDIYHLDSGVHGPSSVRGRKRHLAEKAFLDDLTGNPRSDVFPTPDRPIGYALNDEQLTAYAEFRRRQREL